MPIDTDLYLYGNNFANFVLGKKTDSEDVSFETGQISITGGGNNNIVVTQNGIEFTGYNSLNFYIYSIISYSQPAKKVGFHTNNTLDYIQYGTSEETFYLSEGYGTYVLDISKINGIRYPYCGGFRGYIYRIWLS